MRRIATYDFYDEIREMFTLTMLHNYLRSKLEILRISVFFSPNADRPQRQSFQRSETKFCVPKYFALGYRLRTNFLTLT